MEVTHEALHFGVGSSGGYGGNDGRMVVTAAPEPSRISS